MVLALSLLSSLVRRARRYETGKLALQRLECTVAPAVCDGLRCGVGEDLLFAPLQAVEDSLCGRCGRGFRNLETTVHVGVDRAQHDGMDRHAMACQVCPQRLRHVEG